MKLVLVLTALVAVVLATPLKTDKVFLEKQRDILRLFKYVNQPTYFKDCLEIAETFDFSSDETLFTKPEVATAFYKLYENGLLPRGQIFSVFHEEHLYEAVALYKLFFYAKDYPTFYKTAVWARQNVNEGLFLYVLSVAVVHRPDTYGVILPPIYEVYPNYFFSSEVIHEAYRYKQQYYGKPIETESSFKGYTINSNYSGYYLNLHPEQSLSYFTEDVGLNSFYYYYNIYYPFWLGGEEFDFSNERRGELFYYIYQQLLARYYLERLSNGFGEIDIFNYEVAFHTGYYPSLQYPNGLEFPSRPNFARFQEDFYNFGQKYGLSKYPYSYTKVQDYERRIRDAIDKGYIYTEENKKIDLTLPESIDVLGNLIESNPDSIDSHYYGALQLYARHLVGYSFQPLNKYQLVPSALEHFETSLRDPAFYILYKRVIGYFQKYKYNLPSYSKKDLFFNGVEVTDVHFDRLITYFDYFYSDLSNAVFVSPEEAITDSVNVRVRQQRLNHKSFTYKIKVRSSQDQDATVRIYIGPKYDEYGRFINISQNRLNFVQFDHFKYQLKSGENVIERNSRQTYFYQNDRTSYKDLYKQLVGAFKGQSEFNVPASEAYFGIPRRFLLPKGTYDGLEYQFFVVVSPFVASPVKVEENVKLPYPKIGSGLQYIDGYALGYPFDRPIWYEHLYKDAPNFFSYTTKVYHRDVADINASTANN